MAAAPEASQTSRQELLEQLQQCQKQQRDVNLMLHTVTQGDLHDLKHSEHRWSATALHSLRVSGYICDMLHTQSGKSCGAPLLTGFYLTLKSVFLPPMWRLKVQFVPWKVAVVDGTLLLLLSRTAGKSAMEWERRVLPAAQQQPGCNRRLCRDGKRTMHKSCESHTLTVLKLYVSEPL